MVEELLIELVKIGPIVTLLVAAVIYFLKREKKKEQEIEKLNEELRESEKENLTALYKTTVLFEQFKIELERLKDSVDNLKGNG